ncbi:MAG: hypothetical protein CBE40_01235 [Euryarchaeota archaeon TMED280]|nr:biphenyl 2,3-dioxygenase [Euryarchaeota archaeon]OUX46907.1 MAG: hypothetical protein CBE40_01235 [Euryarchaeota archaeon TMED280]
MNSKLSKFSTRTNAIFAGVTLLAIMFAQNVTAGTIDPEVEYAGDALGRATFFLFFIGYISMGAAFVFFMSERNNVAPEYRTTMTISALIVGIAAFHYYYMRGVYIDTGAVSTDYRYMDWIITVPLMALKFPSLVGKDAITDNKVLGLGFTGVCFVGAIIMIAFGYLGEIGEIDAALGLILGGVGWAMIMVATGLPFGLYDGKGVDNSKIKDELVWSANALRTFILVGWIIYPLGYLVGTDMVDAGADGKEIMAILYNIADMINKIGFGVVAWMGAKKASAMMS